MVLTRKVDKSERVAMHTRVPILYDNVIDQYGKIMLQNLLDVSLGSAPLTS
jgi:hypothetical protein